jgi:exopolysaccharide biosynthesis polyprenyl glycosylphosphotransferase
MLAKLKKIILLGGDLACLHLALFLTLAWRYPQDSWLDGWQSHWPNFLFIFFIWIIVFYINGLYNLNLKAFSRRFFGPAINSASVSSALSVLYFYLNPRTNITPKTNLLIFIIIFFLLFLAWRQFSRLLTGAAFLKIRLAVIGDNAKTDKLLKQLEKQPGSGYEVALALKSLDEISCLASDVRAKNIQAIVIGDDFDKSPELSAALLDCLPQKIDFFSYPLFFEILCGQVPVEAINPDWFLNNLREGQKRYFDITKQTIDYFLSFIILAISLPFWPLIGLGIKLGSPGPVFFRQTRLGKNEKPFTIIKFRTMRLGGNDSLNDHGEERITGFGSLLRRTRLDEIPQVLNILRGEMSLIGPRPERPEIVADLEKQIPFYKTRLLIKPGLTGWDQISGDYHSFSQEDSLAKLQHDLFYLKNRSFYLDMSISLKTIATMMSRAGR